MKSIKKYVLNIIIILRTKREVINPLMRVIYGVNFKRLHCCLAQGTIKKIQLNFKEIGLPVYSDKPTRIYNASVTENFFHKRVFTNALRNSILKFKSALADAVNFNCFKVLIDLCTFKKIMRLNANQGGFLK